MALTCRRTPPTSQWLMVKWWPNNMPLSPAKTSNRWRAQTETTWPKSKSWQQLLARSLWISSSTTLCFPTWAKWQLLWRTKRLLHPSCLMILAACHSFQHLWCLASASSKRSLASWKNWPSQQWVCAMGARWQLSKLRGGSASGTHRWQLWWRLSPWHCMLLPRRRALSLQPEPDWCLNEYIEHWSLKFVLLRLCYFLFFLYISFFTDCYLLLLLLLLIYFFIINLLYSIILI